MLAGVTGREHPQVQMRSGGASNAAGALPNARDDVAKALAPAGSPLEHRRPSCAGWCRVRGTVKRSNSGALRRRYAGAAEVVAGLHDKAEGDGTVRAVVGTESVDGARAVALSTTARVTWKHRVVSASQRMEAEAGHCRQPVDRHLLEAHPPPSLPWPPSREALPATSRAQVRLSAADTSKGA